MLFLSSHPDRSKSLDNHTIIEAFYFLCRFANFKRLTRKVNQNTMNASVSVICYRHKMLANGESPIMLRIAKDGKRTMRSLGVSVNPAYWDFNKNDNLERD